VTVDLSIGMARGSSDYTGTSSIANIENVEILGAWGDDIVIGSNGANVIHVGSGANHVSSLEGTDIIYGSAYEVETYALPANISWGGRFSLDQGSVAETLSGGAGNDVIYGSGKMNGGTRNDRLVSTQYYGEVSMTGGTGADRFEFDGMPLDVQSHHPHALAMNGRIQDFNAGEGDRMVIDNPFSPENEVYPFAFVGECETRQDIGLDECGYTRTSSDMTVYFGVNEYARQHDDDFALTITLAGYAGPLDQDDFVFI
jgi:RTX calcium-binding nonapeptide repeat (4 copies)